MDKPHFEQLVKGVRQMKRHMTGKKNYVLKKEGGGLVRVISQGYRYGPPEVMAAMARGEDLDPSSYFFRAILRFETGAPYLASLNRTIAVATAERKARQVLLSAYRLL